MSVRAGRAVQQEKKHLPSSTYILSGFLGDDRSHRYKARLYHPTLSHRILPAHTHACIPNPICNPSSISCTSAFPLPNITTSSPITVPIPITITPLYSIKHHLPPPASQAHNHTITPPKHKSTLTLTPTTPFPTPPHLQPTPSPFLSATDETPTPACAPAPLVEVSAAAS